MLLDSWALAAETENDMENETERNSTKWVSALMSFNDCCKLELRSAKVCLVFVWQTVKLGGGNMTHSKGHKDVPDR